METNTCNANHLDADAHLPPRKRLLAGLKRQNSDVNSPAPSIPSIVGSENDAQLNNLSRAHLGNLNLSNEEIVEASRIAAIEAVKVAEAARANAEGKAAKAVKAVAAAKSALELVAILSEAANKDQKRNKTKKHVTVEALYNKKKGSTNCRTDEELARELHRDINSSPRILKNSPGSETKNHKHKRMKNSALSGRTDVCSGVLVPIGEGTPPSTATTSNDNNTVGEVETEGHIKKIDKIMVDLNTSTPDKGDQLKSDNGEAWRTSKPDQLHLKNTEEEAFPSKDKHTESLDSFGRKRGRIKQKKLPLSICSFRDQTGPKEEMKHQGNQTMFPVGPSTNSLMPVERPSMWKCQSFRAPACVNKQNKVMQL